MEVENNHLADEYVQEFVLDHFEDVAVKREALRAGLDVPYQRLPSMPITVPLDSPSSHMLTPPGHQVEEYHHQVVTMGPMHHQGMIVHHGGVLVSTMKQNILMYRDTPGTPPDTPPISNSPHMPDSPHPYQLEALHPKQGSMDESMIWLTQLRGQEPLDLRPCNGEMEVQDWSLAPHPGVIAGGKRMHPEYMHHHQDGPLSPIMGQRPLSVSTSVMSPMSSTGRYTNIGDEIIDDKMLMSLSVRELNKRLHGYPRDQVSRLKQKRRTLKNRGYAQNCRSKRLHQRHELELTNRSLQTEMHRLKMELSRVTQERDLYKHRYEMLRPRATEVLNDSGISCSSGHSNPSSPELYL